MVLNHKEALIPRIPFTNIKLPQHIILILFRYGHTRIPRIKKRTIDPQQFPSPNTHPLTRHIVKQPTSQRKVRQLTFKKLTIIRPKRNKTSFLILEIEINAECIRVNDSLVL